MKSNLTMLLLSAGRRVALMNCFRKDAELLGLSLRVLAADADPALSAACASADVAFAVPRCMETGYGAALTELCRREGVDFVVPTIDTELIPLAALAEALAAKGTRAIVSSGETVALARDKLATARALAEANIAVPRTAAVDEFDPNDTGWSWPLIVKPRSGSSSKGIRLVSRAEYSNPGADHIVQERLSGAEYTVNMFFACDGKVKAIVPHLRLETRGGEVSKAETARHDALEKIGRAMEGALPGAQGPVCFQVLARADGQMAVFEVNARFGGGYPIAHHAGARFSKWLLEEMAGLPSTANNNWREGVRMLRYDAEVFR